MRQLIEDMQSVNPDHLHRKFDKNKSFWYFHIHSRLLLFHSLMTKQFDGFGQAMLLGAGWEEGRGLGPNLNGIIDPIPVKVKLDRFA